MKKIYLVLPLMLFLCFTNLYAQNDDLTCTPTGTENIWNGQIGGLLLPAEGTVRVLIIFAQFPDDNYDIQNTTWVKGQAPTNMQGWVDQNWSTNPTQGSMTHYFNEMSFNKLKFIGTTVSRITPHSRQWYLDNNKNRGYIHKEIIQQLDQTWDFAQFDNWDYEGNYYNINRSDGIVDMIFIVWRNIAHEFPTNPIDSVSIIYNKLNMGRYASLGGSEFTVDNGLRTIKTGFWPDINIPNIPGGSGATMTDWFSENMFRFCIHEFGHYLQGGNDQHVGHGFWGLLSGFGIKNFVANSLERYRLGWINLNTIESAPSQTIQNATLPDFVTSGVAYRLVANAATNEYFYIENHQKTSFWENNQMFLRSPYGNVENGIYVLRQTGTGNDDKFIQCVAADGMFNSTVNQRIQSPWGPQLLPVFKMLNPDRLNGYTDLNWIPWWWNGVYQGEASIHFVEDPDTGLPVLDVEYNGDGTDAFRMDYNQMFSPFSNPSSQRKNKTATPFGFNINGFNSGVASLDIYVGTSIDGPPSKPPLGAFHAGDGPIQYGWAYLAWGADYWDEQPIESDINWSELQRKIGNNGLWVTVYSGPNRWWSDNSIVYDPEHGNTPVFFRVRVRDNQNKWSVWSDLFDTRAFFYQEGNYGVEKKNYNNLIPTINELSSNYPNPFNPTTQISYSIKENSFVILKVYDLLGAEVATLVDETKEAGYHSVEFNASELPSGVYIYTLQIGDFFSSKKMILMK